MGTNNSVTFCNNRPRNHYGVCSGIEKILKQDRDFHPLKSQVVPAKQYLFYQGESPVKTYILRQGWILLTQVSAQGKRQVLRSVLPGDMLGFQTDLNKPFSYSAMTLQDSIVCCVPDLLQLCGQYPELSLKLIWEEESEKNLAEHYMVNIAHRSAREKIAFMAFELYQRLKSRGLNKAYVIPFPLKQEDIADTLGMSTIHVNRTLHKLEQDNLLSLHKYELKLLDCEKLATLVGMDFIELDSCEISNVA